MNMEQIEIEPKILDKLLSIVHKFTGISMSANKKALLQSRLRPRIKKLGLGSYDQYLDLLHSNKDEVQEFINLVTTNETQFFRTQRIWDFFNKDFLPDWSAKNPGKTLKIWSGASSSGEEIYSIAICCEEFRVKNKNFNFQILGTDISTNVLMQAQRAVYSGRCIDNFKTTLPQLFEKYMKPFEGEYKVSSEITSKVRFTIHNLFTSPKEKEYYDVIFLRNVLIYFNATDQEIVLNNIAQGLISDGTLFIGESESLSSLNVPFKYKAPLIYEKVKKENL